MTEVNSNYATRSLERDVERAVEAFEDAKGRLYRSDGSKVYGDTEHTERMEKLLTGLREKVEAVIEEANRDAEKYDREALALSYSDPTKDLTTTDRERFTTSMPLVKEDCEGMAPKDLAERLEAVSAGSDKVAKVLHARYARSRYAAENVRHDEAARSGRRGPDPKDPASLRKVLALTEAIEGQIKDQDTERRRKSLVEAAKRSRGIGFTAKRKLSEVDGTDTRARQEAANQVRAGF